MSFSWLWHESGMLMVKAVFRADVPLRLRVLPQVQLLRIWVQQYWYDVAGS